MVYELLAYGTDSRYRDDIRWREYTTSKKRAEMFAKIPRIQWTDSGHGVVFQSREHKGKRHSSNYILEGYVSEQMGILQEAAKANKPKRRTQQSLMRERIDALEVINKKLVTALINALGSEKSSECRADHHGNCQTHNLQPVDQCWVKLAEEAIAIQTSESENRGGE